MKPRNPSPNRTLSRLAACGSAAAWLLCQTALGQTIPNPSFEADTFTTFPGYVSANGPITGWTGTPAEWVGLNPAGGSPFANNGAIPNGSNVAFIQNNRTNPSEPATLSTTITDLTPGTTYRVTFRMNARGGNTPTLKIYVDGLPVLLASGAEGLATANVTASNPYWYVAFDFLASAASQTLALVNDATGDQTLLVDDFKIAPSSGKWAVESWSWDGDTGVDPTFLYTHAYNFGSSASPVINGITFTGIGGSSPSVPGRFSTTFLGSGPVEDTFNYVSGEGAAMARWFVYGGNVPSTSAQSIALEGLTPNTEYVITVYSVAWEDPAIGSRWVTFSMGNDYLTVNQDQFYNNGGIRVTYRYTSDANGRATLKFAPLVPSNVSFHVYGFANREAVSRFVAPTISSQPRSLTTSPGLAVSVSVAASGVPLPTYQWRFNGANIPGATDTTLGSPSIEAENAGNYSVVVANPAGSVTSAVARITVGIPMLNPSFEEDTFTTWPGYVSGNFPITGWASLPNHGLNPANGSPFANNGIIPHGTTVAFMQGDGALSQNLTGLTVGAQYYVHYFENARTGPTPALAVQVGGVPVVGTHLVPPVGSGNYYEVTSEAFIATATEMELAFIKSNPLGGDTTALVDNVAVVPLAAATAPVFTLQPLPVTAFLGQAATFTGRALGSLPMTYQWRLNGSPVAGATSTVLAIPAVQFGDEGDYTLVATGSGGAVTSSVARLSLLERIPTLLNTGVDAAGNPLPAAAVDPFWTLATNPDGGAATVYVGNDGWPIQAGTWLVNTATSKWVGSRPEVGNATIPLGDYTYRTTFDLTGRDTNTVIINGRWASDNWGTTVRVNGNVVTTPPSFNYNAWTAFTLASTNATFLPGLNTLEFVVNNDLAGPTGLRLEFTLASARTLPGIAPAIATPPQGRTVAEGDTVTLNVTATGTLPLSYQWQKNGANLSGQTTATLVLTGVTTNDTAGYRVIASNPWGSATSAAAVVTIAYRPIPGVFGTGVGANGQLLGDGAVDPHYTLAASADPNFPGPDAYTITNVWPIQSGVWVVNGPSSRWIGASPAQRQDLDPTQGNAPGDYTYQTTFDLTGYDLSRVTVLGSWAVDNSGKDINLNGVATGITAPGFASLASFTLTSGLNAGPNTLDFLIYNDPNINAPDTPNPCGLRVDLKAYLYLLDPVKLQVGYDGENVTIGWAPALAGQKLLWAPEPTGPWTEIPNAANPYAAPASGNQRFYRIAQ